MGISKKLLAILLLTLFFASCNKGHYDVSNVNGINAEGEMLLPVASKTFTLKDMMERFEIQDLIEWTEAGDMTFSYDDERNRVVDGAEMLKFKDVDYETSYVFENPYPGMPHQSVDTMVSIEHPIVFESENIHVMRALMKSGRLDFMLASNSGSLQRVVLHSDNIKDEAGNDFELDLPVVDSTFGFDMDGLRFVAETANTMNLRYDLYFSVYSLPDLELTLDISIKGRDLAFSEMQGFVDRYDNRNSIDSAFIFFPVNVGGMLELEGVEIKVSERNTFDLGARLVVDTAMVYNEGMPPYSIISPLPLSVELPHQLEYHEVFNQKVNGQVNAMGGRIYVTSNFIVNPENYSGMVTVYDSDRIDTRIGVEIPFSFALDDITYLDTVNMNLQHLDMPDMIEKLTMELKFTSTLPLNLKASFFMYDSTSDRITDTLLMNSDLICASFDGKPVKTDLTLIVDEDRVGRVMQSNRIIMSYLLDTDAHDVNLNVNQKLSFFLKVRAKYNANVDLKDLD